MHTLYHILPVLFHLSLVFSLSLRLGGGGKEELVDPQLYNLPYNQVGEASASDRGHSSLEFQDLSGSVSRMINEYVGQDLKIYPKVLKGSDKDIWPPPFRYTDEKQPLKGDRMLANYALSKFWQKYQLDGHSLTLEQDPSKANYIRSISRDKILYRLPNADIPIYFVLGAYEKTPTPSLTKSFGICFWMFEHTKIHNEGHLLKHFLGKTHIPISELQNHIMNHLPDEIL